jgi:hypothetical protein
MVLVKELEMLRWRRCAYNVLCIVSCSFEWVVVKLKMWSGMTSVLTCLIFDKISGCDGP